MHREKVRKQVLRHTVSELHEWREHVLFCLNYYRHANNSFEVDECEYLLGLLNKQLEELEKDKNK